MKDSSMIVQWDLSRTDGTPFTLEDPKPELPRIPSGAILVLGGRAPIWRYGFAFHAAHGGPAAVIASWDPKLGAVIIASHSPGYKEGSVLEGFSWR